MRSLLLSLAAVAMSVSAAQAVVLQIDFSIVTTGNPNPAVGTVVIDGPFDVDVLNSQIGLTASGFNFAVDGAVTYSYKAATDFLSLGGSNDGVGGTQIGSNDFIIQIEDFLTAPVATAFTLLVQAIRDTSGSTRRRRSPWARPAARNRRPSTRSRCPRV
jgi:hypothetical protein